MLESWAACCAEAAQGSVDVEGSPADAQPRSLPLQLPSDFGFAGVPATSVEQRLVARVLADAAALEPASGWLRALSPWDALRYVRAALNERRGCEEGAVLQHACERLAATARWRMDERVDGIVAREANNLAMPAFFRAHKTTAPQDEARWLAGTDARGRPVALFQVDRHVPGEISTELWSRFVAYNAEATIAERQVAVGPGGQFSLIVDRTRSSVRNQDPRLAVAVLPALTAHYPELLGNVYVAPINRIFWAVWRVVRLFLAEQTRDKFVLIRGADWRERLAEAVGGDCVIPRHMRRDDAQQDA